MSYRRKPSPFLTGVAVGIGVWVVGYLFSLVFVAALRPSPLLDAFSTPGAAGVIYVFGSVFALLLLVGETYSASLVLPGVVGLLVAVAGGAVVPVRAELGDGWAVTKAGAAVGVGVFLATLAALTVYLLPSTPASNTPISFRYVALLFGNLLLPALAGALGGALQHALAARQS